MKISSVNYALIVCLTLFSFSICEAVNMTYEWADYT